MKSRMHIPFIDLSRSFNAIKSDVISDWQACVDQCEFVGGERVRRFEERMTRELSVHNFTACANGTDALMVSLQALGVKAGMRVALPNMTFWAPYEAVVQLGAVPVLVDIDETDLQMDFQEFKEACEHYDCGAAILVHLYGWCSAKLQEYRDYCRERGMHLIEDAAQAYGVQVAGEPVFAGAELSTLSFYPAKVLGAAGDAGGITSLNPKVSELVGALCDHGRAGHYTYDYVGWNSRMGGLQAAFLNRALDRVEGWLQSRREAEAFYQDFFAGRQDLCRVWKAPVDVQSNGYLNVITPKHKTGDEVVAALTVAGVGCARTYPQTLDMQPPAADALRSSGLEKSHRLATQVVNLPLFAGITMDECRQAASTLLKVLEK